MHKQAQAYIEMFFDMERVLTGARSNCETRHSVAGMAITHADWSRARQSWARRALLSTVPIEHKVLPVPKAIQAHLLDDAKMLKAAKFEGPISLHEEYLDHRKPELVEEHLQAIKKDFEILNNWLSNA